MKNNKNANALEEKKEVTKKTKNQVVKAVTKKTTLACLG